MFIFVREKAWRELLDRLEKQQSELKLIRGEWHDTLDRINRLTGRLAKREQLDRPAEEHVPNANGTKKEIDPISAQILARRSAGRGLLPGRLYRQREEGTQEG